MTWIKLFMEQYIMSEIENINEAKPSRSTIINPKINY
jgi:hypothetical protein